MNVLFKKQPIVVGQGDDCEVLGGDEGIAIRLASGANGVELMGILTKEEASAVMAALGASIVGYEAAQQAKRRPAVFGVRQ